MNPFELTLLAKAGQEHGWENAVLDDNSLILSSARHRAKLTIRQLATGWHLELHANPLVVEETKRAFPELNSSGSAWQFLHIPNYFLRRIAELAVALPLQPMLDFEQQIQVVGTSMATEIERLIRQRIGQDIFRKALLNYWNNACAVTSIALPELLRASHAKPWAHCTNDAERLDVYNGFLLTANLDALFDRGLITFSTAGKLTCAPCLTCEIRQQLGLDQPLHLRYLTPQHAPYLAYHREKVFRDK